MTTPVRPPLDTTAPDSPEPDLSQVDWAAHATYAGAVKACDLVLEGGIAGGVVYPRAILEIARTRRLRNMGGASAGAIGVALAAAAEYGRAQGLTGAAQGFPGLAAVDVELRRPGLLRSLFDPRREARPLLEFVVRLFAEKSPAATGGAERTEGLRIFPSDALTTRWRKKWRRARPWLRALQAFGDGHALGGLLGGGLGLVLAGPLVVWLGGLGTPFGFASAALGAVAAFAAGAILGGLLGAVNEAFTLVEYHMRPGTQFGICSGTHRGRSPPTAPPAPTEALFDWLHRHVQTIVGRPLDGPPLTFDDLNGLPARQSIQVRMVTTNLNARRAHRVPFEDGELLLYRRSDLQPILPEAVYAALARTDVQPPAGFEHCRLPPGGDFGWFPIGGRLPVVVGVRLSMSFPLMFAAVRLYMVKSAATAPRPGGVELSPERDLVECWFSDGGVCNNFPLQVFDTWFPERPTFGINLSDAPLSGSALRDVARTRATDAVEHRGLADERRDDWAPHDLRGVGDFLAALTETLFTHRDNALMRLAGYRERVATVHLNAGEGALNIDMPSALIDGLADRGRFAAQRLAALELDRHQWVRLRTLMGALENEMLRMQEYGLGGDSDVAGGDAPGEGQGSNVASGGLNALRHDWMALIARARAAEDTASPFYPSVAPGGTPTAAELDAWYTTFAERAETLLVLMGRWLPETSVPFLDAGRERSASPHPRGEHRISSKT